MSTKREPLFGHQDGYTCDSFFGKECDCDVSIYEAARAKDAELIQRLVDALQYIGDIGVWLPEQADALNAAAAAGFKPSKQ